MIVSMKIAKKGVNMKKKPSEVTDQEIIDMIISLNKRAERYNAKAFDKDLFEKLGLTQKGKPLTLEEFKNIFGDKLSYGVGMLQTAIDRNYIWNTNKKYKETIVKILEQMGLNNQAKTVNEMSYKEFKKLAKDNKFDNVYTIYHSYDDIREAQLTAPSNYNEELLETASEDVRKYLQGVLGY